MEAIAQEDLSPEPGQKLNAGLFQAVMVAKALLLQQASSKQVFKAVLIASPAGYYSNVSLLPWKRL